MGVTRGAVGSRCRFGRSPGLRAVPLSAIWSDSHVLVAHVGPGRCCGQGGGQRDAWEQGRAAAGAVLSDPGRLPDAAQSPGFVLLLLFWGTRPGLAVGLGVLWPQTVAVPLPRFPQLLSHHFPVRSHWKLAPVLVSQGLSWPGGWDGWSRGS